MICNLKILIPHVVDPAHPPMKVINKNINIMGVPHISYSAVTKPVPVKIDVTLNNEYLTASNEEKLPVIIR